MVKAVIMAGGEGSRLRPLTVTRPKPMIPLANTPIIVRLIKHLKENTGISDIGVTLHYLPNVIMSHLHNGADLGVKLHYAVEEKPLGTAGGVKNLVELIGWDDTILVISGDVVTNIDLKRLVEFHFDNRADLTMAVRKETDVTRFGIVALDERGRVLRFKEKPSPNEVFSDIINTGIYVIEPHVFKKLEAKRSLDFASDVIPRLLADNFRVFAMRVDDYYWSDIGDIEQYRATHVDLLSRRLVLPGGIEGREIRPGVFIGRNTHVDVERVIPPVVVGNNSKIISSTLGPYTVIGSNVVVEEGSRVENSIVFDNAYIGSASVVEGAVIGEKVTLGDHVVVVEGVVIGDETRVGRGASVKARVKIWPMKIIDPYTTVPSDIRWGVRWSRVLFEPWGLTGVLNIDITPEFLVKLGSAIGSILREGESVIAGSDVSPASHVGLQSMIVGFMSVGVGVRYAGYTPLPFITFGVNRLGTSGGVYVNTLQGEYAKIRVKVFDREGKFLPKNLARKIEDVFFREQLRRSAEIDAGFLVEENGLEKLYAEEASTLLDLEEVDGSKLSKVLVDCGGGVVSKVIADIFFKTKLPLYYSNCTDVRTPRAIRRQAFTELVDSSIAIVKGTGFRLGFIFDSDGDKLTLVTDRHGLVAGDKLVALMAQVVLTERPGSRVLLPETTPRAIVEFVERLGGKVELAETGLMGLSEKINTSYALAADERGSIIYPEFHYGPDAIFTAMRLLVFASRSDINEAVSRLPLIHRVVKEIYLPFEKRGLFARELTRALDMREIEMIDGLKIFDEGVGWVYLRFSRTDPVVEVIFEPIEEGKLEYMIKSVMDLIGRVLEKI
ncbi:sugar phosphate nucleotidyltransferase [Thermogladius sp.]|uniref:sugar phosphate nucleotidyltransferase n=1 Tax=Thermogladius sp. TaxID=2023064 RepID=UPI003D0E5C2D